MGSSPSEVRTLSTVFVVLNKNMMNASDGRDEARSRRSVDAARVQTWESGVGNGEIIVLAPLPVNDDGGT